MGFVADCVSTRTRPQWSWNTSSTWSSAMQFHSFSRCSLPWMWHDDILDTCNQWSTCGSLDDQRCRNPSGRFLLWNRSVWPSSGLSRTTYEGTDVPFVLPYPPLRYRDTCSDSVPRLAPPTFSNLTTTMLPQFLGFFGSSIL